MSASEALGASAARTGDLDEAWRISDAPAGIDDPGSPGSISIKAQLGEQGRAVESLRQGCSEGLDHGWLGHCDSDLEPLSDDLPLTRS